MNKLSKKLIKKLDSSGCKALMLKTNGVIQPAYNYILTKPTTNTIYTQEEVSILEKLLINILKLFSVKIERDEIQFFYQEIINIEWKELAKRIECILLCTSLCTIILIPILLFGKYFLRDFITFDHLKSPCGCDYSFVRKK